MKSVQKGYELPEESEIGMLFEKSAQRLSAAQQLLKSGFYEDAVGRAYYSMFFAAKAVLLKKEISVKTHRGPNFCVRFRVRSTAPCRNGIWEDALNCRRVKRRS